MPDLLPTPPTRRPELLIRPLGEDGRYVVKDPLTGEYFHLGAEEHFLLSRLDGRTESEEIRAAFEHAFGQALCEEELDDFVAAVREQGLLAGGGCQ